MSRVARKATIALKNRTRSGRIALRLLAFVFLVALSPVAVIAQPPGATGLTANAREIREIESPRIPGGEGDSSRTLEQLMSDHETPALSVAVIKDYKLLWAKAYGRRSDLGGAPAINVKTLFQAASISKPVSAMAVLKAVQSGRFGLDDDINTLLKSWTLRNSSDFTAESKVTPRMLLSMTAGTTVPGFPGYVPSATMPTVAQVLGSPDATGETPANTEPVVVGWEPNTKTEYSGGGSTVLQLALSEVLEKPFDVILQETVLDPLNMADSCFCQPLPESRHGNAARSSGPGPRRDRESQGDASWHVYPELYAAGLWTTATDLAKYMVEVQLSLEGRSNKILNPSMTRKMVTPGGLGNYALGFTAGSTSPHLPAPPGEANRLFGHTGGNWGFRTNFEAHLEGGNGFVILSNSDGANPIIFYELPARIRKAYGWSKPGNDASAP